MLNLYFKSNSQLDHLNDPQPNKSLDGLPNTKTGHGMYPMFYIVV